MTREQIELALDSGHLWAAMRNGRYWKLRRNGATQRWKTRPAEYRIPVKAGLKSYGNVTHTSYVSRISDADWRSAHFVATMTDVDPNDVKRDELVNVLNRIAAL